MTGNVRKCIGSKRYNIFCGRSFEVNLDNFSKNCIKTSTYICKECDTERNKQRAISGDTKKSVVKRKYKLSESEHDALVAQHKGNCKLCGSPESVIDKRTKKVRSLAIDHDHKTGRVRGLLCTTCNMTIGGVESKTAKLLNLNEYLDRIKQYLNATTLSSKSS